MKVNIEMIRDKPLKITDHETNLLAGNDKAKVPILHIRNMKTSWWSTKATMKRQADCLHRQPKGEAPKDRKQRERSKARGWGMVNRRVERRKNLVLETLAGIEIPTAHEFSQLLVVLKLHQLGRRHTGLV